MQFSRLQWLFPIAVTLHNSEEAIWMPGWVSRHATQLPMQPPGAAQIRFGLVVLTAVAWVVTYRTQSKGRGSVWAYLLFGGVVAMLANVFVPHLPASLVFRSYTPGVVTAVLINLPGMSLLAIRAIGDQWVHGWRAAAFAVAVPLATVAIIPALLVMGRVIF
jgi:hypothetical protein